MTKLDRDDISSNPRVKYDKVELFRLIEKRLSRRSILTGMGASLSLAACHSTQKSGAGRETPKTTQASPKHKFSFAEITRGADNMHHVPIGYDSDVLLSWGDPIFSGGAKFDPMTQSAVKQKQQFGYNNDFIGFVPLSQDSALLCVNHEYSSTKDMFPALQRIANSPERIAVEVASQGTSIIEIIRTNGRWTVASKSAFNRRITGDTLMALTGPAAGHPRLKTPEDPTGKRVLGTLGNCAGGITPWGTYLTAEENIDSYFGGTLLAGHPEAKNHKRMGVPDGSLDWHNEMPRFNIGIAPNEPNRFGWIVEIDPYDPTSTPKKRTALGRFKHEGAETVLAPDGRVVVYMGDDQRGDYLYKFVSSKPYDAAQPNPNLLDEGTLYVAKFDETGIDWLALTYGNGPLTKENGFNSQADVLISARLAADALGATSMDRPEDVQPNRKTGKVYVMLTNNKNRSDALDAGLSTSLNVANPRAKNTFGHIIEIIEPNGNFAATRSSWEFLVKCGDPSHPKFGAVWNPQTSINGWFGSPDNCAIDPAGGMWVATDGNAKTGAADGLWAMETEGIGRGTGKAFFRAPEGAEVCGPCFSPDGKTLFISVQHPGGDDDTTYETPLNRWPNFQDNMPPRPSVVAIYKKDGGVIGS